MFEPMPVWACACTEGSAAGSIARGIVAMLLLVAGLALLFVTVRAGSRHQTRARRLGLGTGALLVGLGLGVGLVPMSATTALTLLAVGVAVAGAGHLAARRGGRGADQTSDGAGRVSASDRTSASR